MKIFTGTKIDFISKRYVYFGISLALMAAAAVSVVMKGGFSVGIDFEGGYLFQLKVTPPIPMSDLRSVLSDSLSSFEIQNVVGLDDVIVRVKKGEVGTQELMSAMEKSIVAASPDAVVRWDRVEYVGPVVGRYLKRQAVMAIFFSLAGIIAYVAFRFKSLVWGAAGVAALAHDVWVVLGFLSFFNREITLTVIAALLTLAGYSINDTIVIFDRIREKMRLHSKEALSEVINRSINETLSRTVITSLTLFAVVLALYIFGGAVLHDFSFALLVGVIVGTYSSIFVAAPIVYEWYAKRSAR